MGEIELTGGLTVSSGNLNGDMFTNNNIVSENSIGSADTWGNIVGDIDNQLDLKNKLDSKQATLISGTNIKTINNESVLGSGNLVNVKSVNTRTGDVTLTKSDVGLDNVDNTSDINKPVSSATQSALDGKQATLVSGTNIKTINGFSVLGSGNIEVTATALVDDVTVNGTSVVEDKIAKVIVPTKTSDITNDSGFIDKDVNNLTNYSTTSDMNSAIANHHDNTKYDASNPDGFVNKDVNDLTNYTLSSELSSVATSGDYDDLTNKPTIPSKTSELTNDSDFITTSYHDATKENADATILKQANVVNETTSTSTIYPLSANMGKTLQTEINNLKNIGRFLAIWDASTGTPTSEPSVSPYTYKVGDYFRIGVQGNKNPAPNPTYVIGEINWVTGSTLNIGDVIYCSNASSSSTTWVRQATSGGGTVQDVQVDNVSVLSGGIANVQLSDFGITATSSEINTLDGVTSNIQSQLDGKQETLVSGTNIKTINNNSILGSGNITISELSTGDAQTLDANTLIDSGTYYLTSSSANIPVAYYGIITVVETSTYRVQYYTRATTSATEYDKIWMRKYYNGSWTDWVLTPRRNDIDNIDNAIDDLINQWGGNYTSAAAINAGDGTVGGSTSTSATDYIPVKPNTTYFFNLNHISSSSRGTAWYDASKTYISGFIHNGSGKVGARTSPENAYYVRTTISTSALSSASINYPSTYTDYHPIGLHKDTFTLLWTNPSPSSAFASQTINVNINNYKWLLLIYDIRYTRYNSMIIENVLNGRYMITGNDILSGDILSMVRTVTTLSNQISFGGCAIATGSSSSANQNYLVPIKILGIR